MSRRATRRPAVAVGALVALAVVPGWRGELVPVPHQQVLEASRAAPAGRVFGVALGGSVDGERWHAQYVGGPVAPLVHGLGVRARLPSLLPPDFAAHLPAGSQHADGYYRVDVRVHWPWWWPGAGVRWRAAAQ